MFGETTISNVKIRNHPIETTIYKWLFGVPGYYNPQLGSLIPYFKTTNRDFDHCSNGFQK